MEEGEKIRRERRSRRQGVGVKEVQSRRMRRRIEIRWRRSKMTKKERKEDRGNKDKLENRIEGDNEATRSNSFSVTQLGLQGTQRDTNQVC